MPLVPANMDTVIGDDLADILIANGSMPLFHRFTTLEQQETWVQKYQGTFYIFLFYILDNCFISCGMNNIQQTVELLKLGARGCVIDIAHGHSESMVQFIRTLKKLCPDKGMLCCLLFTNFFRGYCW